jgi:hypothetical protein
MSKFVFLVPYGYLMENGLFILWMIYPLKMVIFQ